MRHLLLLSFAAASCTLAGCADSSDYNSSPGMAQRAQPVHSTERVVYRVPLVPNDNANNINLRDDSDRGWAVISDRDWDTLFRTLYGECRNQSDKEIGAIADVVYNRWQSGLWGNTLSSVLLAPNQFSVWNKHDRSRRIISNDQRIDPRKMSRVSLVARQTIEGRLNGTRRDSTGGATHFYHPASMVLVRYCTHRCSCRKSTNASKKCYPRQRYAHATPQWAKRGLYASRQRIGQAIFIRPRGF